MSGLVGILPVLNLLEFRMCCDQNKSWLLRTLHILLKVDVINISENINTHCLFKLNSNMQQTNLETE